MHDGLGRTGVQGLYDGFEGYRVPSTEEAAHALLNGLVILDANTLLNLYRFNANTTNDFLRVLERLGDRLAVPHQALHEFWRNRLSAIGNPNTAARDVQSAFDKNRKATADAVNRWAKHVGFEDHRRDELHAQITTLYEGLHAVVASGTPKSVAVGTSPTGDPILARLERLLSGKVTPPLDAGEWEQCVTEGKRRADAFEPPGYLDADKASSDLPEGPAGDYLVWYQAVQAAKSRDLDLQLVTGDEKDDWWWRHQAVFLGPRPELVSEKLQQTGHRLFMLRPKDLLAHSAVLEVTVREESVVDAERSRPEYHPRSEWTAEGVVELLHRLDAEGVVQAEVIRVAALSGGEVDRETVYEIGGYDDDRMLRGFTRPTARVTADLQAAGVVADGVAPMLIPLYPDGGVAAAFRIPPEVVRILQSNDRVRSVE
jgi:hypothetical protein